MSTAERTSPIRPFSDELTETAEAMDYLLGHPVTPDSHISWRFQEVGLRGFGFRFLKTLAARGVSDASLLRIKLRELPYSMPSGIPDMFAVADYYTTQREKSRDFVERRDHQRMVALSKAVGGMASLKMDQRANGVPSLEVSMAAEELVMATRSVLSDEAYGKLAEIFEEQVALVA